MSGFAFLASLNSRISFAAVVEHSVDSEVSIGRCSLFIAGRRLCVNVKSCRTEVLARKDYPHHYFPQRERFSFRLHPHRLADDHLF